MMFKKKREPFTMARMATALEVLRAHPSGVPIRYLRTKVACGRDELSTALKNLREEGLVENPTRGVWRAAPVAPPVVEAPPSVGVAGSYADLQARTIAAEERAQCLAEQLAEERRLRGELRRELDRYIAASVATEKAVQAIGLASERKRRKAEKRVAKAQRKAAAAETLCEAIAAIPVGDPIPF